MSSSEVFQLVCDCGQKMRARRDTIGKKFPCPKCGKQVTVQDPLAEEEPDAEPEQSPPVRPSAHETAIRVKASTVGTVLPLLLSSIALALSCATAWIALTSSPLGDGISKYDFTTPEKAIRSQMEIRRSGNVLAQIEMERLLGGKQLEEKIKTLKVHSESNYQGKKILFVSYTENGLSKKQTIAVEKHTDTGLWFPTFVSSYRMTDEALQKAVREWEGEPNIN